MKVSVEKTDHLSDDNTSGEHPHSPRSPVAEKNPRRLDSLYIHKKQSSKSKSFFSCFSCCVSSDSVKTITVSAKNDVNSDNASDVNVASFHSGETSAIVPIDSSSIVNDHASIPDVSTDILFPEKVDKTNVVSSGARRNSKLSLAATTGDQTVTSQSESSMEEDDKAEHFKSNALLLSNENDVEQKNPMSSLVNRTSVVPSEILRSATTAASTIVPNQIEEPEESGVNQ